MSVPGDPSAPGQKDAVPNLGSAAVVATTIRADRALAARGLARSRSEAVAMIRSGGVLLNGHAVAKPSTPVSSRDELAVADAGPRYVSRAAHKLLSALDAFGDVPVAGRRALDAGACTGGFTQVLLERGAARVAAVDVGHGQLHPALRDDDRVLVREGLNVRTIDLEDIDGSVDLIVSDLSFISLRLVVDALARVAVHGAHVLLMVKPQFEVGRARLPRTGVVTDAGHRRDAVVGVLEAAARAGLRPVAAARSGLPGQDGNVEFFLHLQLTSPPSGPARAGDPRLWLDGQRIDWS